MVLAVGDRRRVWRMAKLLDRAVFLSETAAKLASGAARGKGHLAVSEMGRVAMVLGEYRSVPILVVETQMGSTATQIILTEVLSEALTSTRYRLRRRFFEFDRKYVIRVGTCAGINCGSKERVKLGDIINATHSIGAPGADIQYLVRLDSWRTDTLRALTERWPTVGEGFSITSDGHPRIACSQEVVEAIRDAAEELDLRGYHSGGNVTKDSLYSELNESIFLRLCRDHDCRSTDTELTTIGVLATRAKASFGMVSAVVGLIPGGSFAKSESVKERAEAKAMHAGLEAMRLLAQRNRV